MRAAEAAQRVWNEANQRHQAGSKQRAVDQLVLVRRAARQIVDDAQHAREAADRALRIAEVSLASARTARVEAEQAQQQLAELHRQRSEAFAAAEAERADVMRRYEEVKQQSELIAAQLREWEEREAAAAAAAQNPPPNAAPEPSDTAPWWMSTSGWRAAN